MKCAMSHNSESYSDLESGNIASAESMLQDCQPQELVRQDSVEADG